MSKQTVGEIMYSKYDFGYKCTSIVVEPLPQWLL